MPLLSKPATGEALTAIKAGIGNLASLGAASNFSNIAQYTVAAEGLDSGTKSQASAAKTKMDEVISSVFKSVQGKLGLSKEGDHDVFELGLKAAKMIAPIASSPAIYFNTLKSGFKTPEGITRTVGVEQLNLDGVANIGDVTVESYDAQAISNAVYFSSVFNFAMVRQDPFAEAFFPVIVIDTLESGIVVDVDVVSYMNEFLRDINGAPNADAYGKTPIIKAMFSEQYLLNDRNKVVPVLRSENADLFLQTLRYEDKSSGEAVTTAPLVVGKTINLLGISQTDAMGKRGSMDQSDTLDRTVNLESITIKVAGNDKNGVAVEEFITIPLGMNSRARFTVDNVGNYKNMVLNFHTKLITLGAETKVADGTVSKIFSNVLANNKAMLEIVANGTLNTTTGDVTVYGSKVGIDGVFNAANQQLTSTDPIFASINSNITSIVIAGYVLESYRTNSNQRTKGQLLTTDRYRVLYNVPFRSGTTVQGPQIAIGGVENDISKLGEMIIQTGAKMSAFAVRKLLGTADTLRFLAAAPAIRIEDIEGIGGYYVNPYFKEATLDVAAAVDSITSADRIGDIGAVFVNKIREYVTEMMLKSNYYVAHTTYKPGQDIMVIIGTDVTTQMYLCAGGETTIKISEGIIGKVVATANPAMTGKMVLSFASDRATENNQPDAFNFGNTLWSPTMTIEVMKQTNNANNRELTNVPRFAHIVNLPVMTLLSVENIDGALAKVAINFKNV